MSTPALATLNLVVEAEVRNPRSYTPTEGANAGKTYYSANAELATPGSIWSTLRIRVRSVAPITAGVHRLSIVQLDGQKGEAVADLVRA